MLGDIGIFKNTVHPNKIYLQVFAVGPSKCNFGRWISLYATNNSMHLTLITVESVALSDNGYLWSIPNVQIYIAVVRMVLLE